MRYCCSPIAESAGVTRTVERRAVGVSWKQIRFIESCSFYTPEKKSYNSPLKLSIIHIFCYLLQLTGAPLMATHNIHQLNPVERHNEREDIQIAVTSRKLSYVVRIDTMVTERTDWNTTLASCASSMIDYSARAQKKEVLHLTRIPVNGTVFPLPCFCCARLCSYGSNFSAVVLILMKVKTGARNWITKTRYSAAVINKSNVDDSTRWR